MAEKLVIEERPITKPSIELVSTKRGMGQSVPETKKFSPLLLIVVLIVIILVALVAWYLFTSPLSGSFSPEEAHAVFLDIKKSVQSRPPVSDITAGGFAINEINKISIKDAEFLESKIDLADSSQKRYALVQTEGIAILALAIGIVRITNMDFNKGASKETFIALLDGNVSGKTWLLKIANTPVDLNGGYFLNQPDPLFSEKKFSVTFMNQVWPFVVLYLDQYIDYKQQAIKADFGSGNVVAGYVEAYQVEALNKVYGK